MLSWDDTCKQPVVSNFKSRMLQVRERKAASGNCGLAFLICFITYK